MKTDIILAGVGGQGILSIAGVISMAALNKNLHIKQSEVHGMSQRGGAVQSHLRVSDKAIASDLIPLGRADIILSVEPMEALRYIPYLKNGGWIITSTNPFKNIDNYPEEKKIIDELKQQGNVILVDSNKLAMKVGSKLTSNIVMLGASSPFIGIEISDLELGVKQIFERKGEMIVNKNIEALRVGREFSEEILRETV